MKKKPTKKFPLLSSESGCNSAPEFSFSKIKLLLSTENKIEKETLQEIFPLFSESGCNSAPVVRVNSVNGFDFPTKAVLMTRGKGKIGVISGVLKSVKTKDPLVFFISFYESFGELGEGKNYYNLILKSGCNSAPAVRVNSVNDFDFPYKSSLNDEGKGKIGVISGVLKSAKTKVPLVFLISFTCPLANLARKKITTI
ncbi:hypothetical protein CEXT_431311 [Caerostris extrusa]|uniref:Ribosomal protein L5 n=1 Tax=Caerostris extrusa TaxID=172846 RepID=A0AAV4XD85_CAEEX|nr:hypothetical protein CEXT_431311 [Caerostris extrusa]